MSCLNLQIGLMHSQLLILFIWMQRRCLYPSDVAAFVLVTSYSTFSFGKMKKIEIIRLTKSYQCLLKYGYSWDEFFFKYRSLVIWQILICYKLDTVKTIFDPQIASGHKNDVDIYVRRWLFLSWSNLESLKSTSGTDIGNFNLFIRNVRVKRPYSRKSYFHLHIHNNSS